MRTNCAFLDASNSLVNCKTSTFVLDQKSALLQTQGSYKKQDLKIKDFSRTFQHLIILFQDHFIFIESALNVAMQKWVLRKQDTL